MSSHDEPACYYPYMGKIYRNYGRTPCRKPNGPDDIVNCCAAGDICLDNNTCMFTTHANSNHSQTGYTIASCTDPNYNGPACSRHCSNGAHTDIIYNAETSTWSCCESSPDYGYEGWNCVANPGGESWKAPAPASLSTLAIIPSPTQSPPIIVATSYTAGTGKHSATPTAESKGSSKNARPVGASSPEKTPYTRSAASPTPISDSHTGLSPGAKAGVGVGVTAGAIAALLLLGYFLFWKRFRHRFLSKQKIPSIYEKSTDENPEPSGSTHSHENDQRPAEELYYYYKPQGESGAYYNGPAISPEGSPPQSQQQQQQQQQGHSPTRGTRKERGSQRSRATNTSPDGVSPPSAHPGSTAPNPSYSLTPQQPNSAPVLRQPHPSVRRHLQTPQVQQQRQSQIPSQNHLGPGHSSGSLQQTSDLHGAVMAASHGSFHSARQNSNRRHCQQSRNNSVLSGASRAHQGQVIGLSMPGQNPHIHASGPYDHALESCMVREETDEDGYDSLTGTDDDDFLEHEEILIQAPWHPNNPQTEIVELPAVESNPKELPTTEMKNHGGKVNLSVARKSRPGEERVRISGNDGGRGLAVAGTRGGAVGSGVVGGNGTKCDDEKKIQTMKDLPEEPAKGSPWQTQTQPQIKVQQESPRSKSSVTGSPRDKGLRKK